MMTMLILMLVVVVTKLLEEETLEEVGSIDDGENKHGGKVDGEDGVQQPPLEHQGHLQTCVCVACIVVGERPETICDSVNSHVTWDLESKVEGLGSDDSL